MLRTMVNALKGRTKTLDEVITLQNANDLLEKVYGGDGVRKYKVTPSQITWDGKWLLNRMRVQEFLNDYIGWNENYYEGKHQVYEDKSKAKHYIDFRMKSGLKPDKDTVTKVILTYFLYMNN